MLSFSKLVKTDTCLQGLDQIKLNEAFTFEVKESLNRTSFSKN